MCGFVVTASFTGKPADAALLERACDAMAHRGPDDSGIAVYDTVGFGFRRLAILDLSPAGHQPMELPEEDLSVVFNGEIYNYVELKRELEQLGRRFRSSSDTEVLLHAYAQWGARCVERFNGMWAFVILDRKRRQLFGSRDRFGVKPLYRWTDGKKIIFASEIKAIVASGWYRPSVNWQTAASFLCDGHLDQGSDTFFADVEQVPPGSTFLVHLDGRIETQRFWSIASLAQDAPKDPVEAFRSLFEDSVRLRMRSDVPVGVCLSGGIDSNAIIAMMTRLRAGGVDYPLEAFSFIPKEFSEADYIHATIRQTGATLNELDTTPGELWDLLVKALWHYDEPVHSPTALIGYQLMKLARSRGITVVLNGQGADEVNAGYHSYFRTYWTELLHAGRVAKAMAEMSEYAGAKGTRASALKRSTLAHWMRSELRGLTPWRAAAASSKPRPDWYAADLVQKAAPLPPALSGKSLRETLTRSIEMRPLPLYLRVEDRNSMAHSVEARLPFLDYRLVSLAFSLPSDWKMRGRWNKFVVREAMKGIVAEPVRTRVDKMGFPTPGARWFANEWYEPVLDLLSTRRLRESGICDLDRVRLDLERHRAGSVDLSGRLFHLAQFGVWLDRNLSSPAAAVESRTVVPFRRVAMKAV